MCSIVGLQGNVNAEDIVKMLKVSKNRGPDSSGVYLDKIYENINLDEFDYDGTCQIAFGHNLLSIYDSDTRMSKPQPVSNENLVLVFNGELYNFNTLKNFLSKVGVDAEITSDADALLYLIDFYAEKLDFLKAVVILAGDLLRDAAGLGVVRHQDDMASGEADEGREGRALEASLLFLQLYDDLGPLGECGLEVRMLRAGHAVSEVLLGDFLERQEPVAFNAVVHEGGFNAGLDP